MEVHHHPQLEHKPKAWKEYLLEGLMIFVAVTMGFFAESLREHMADKSKERKMIAALVKDIKKDSTILNHGVNFYMPEHNRWVDSLDEYINNGPIKGNEKRLVVGVINATNWWVYTPPEVTLDILKSSGNFNIIDNEKVKTEILTLNSNINEYNRYSEFLTAAEHTVDTSSTSIIDRKNTRALIDRIYERGPRNTDGFISDNDVPKNLTFITYAKPAFQKLLVKITQVDHLINDLSGLYRRILTQEKRLLDTLKEQYDLEDE